MNDNNKKIPLDAKLLSYAIIELNISRRNVAIYPQEHPSMERSLMRAFDFLKQLFQLRPEITFGIAKDTIIVDEYQLDKKNPVYQEFALSLNKIHIASVTFKNGLTKDELYQFNCFLLEKIDHLPVTKVREVFKKNSFPHVAVVFIDYGTFSFKTSTTDQTTREIPLWEKYVYGLIKNPLQTEDITDAVRDIPPETFSNLLNKFSDAEIKEETYDRVITAYMRSSPQRTFSGQDCKRMFEFFNRLKPDLKKKFLSSSIRTFSQDKNLANQALAEMPFKDIIAFLDSAIEQRITVPQHLMDLITSLVPSSHGNIGDVLLHETVVLDDVLIPTDSAELLKKKNFEKLLSDKYQQDIQQLFVLHTSDLKTSQLIELEHEFIDELIDQRFNQIILELLRSETLSEIEYRSLVNIMRQQTEHLLWLGQFGQFVEILKILEINQALHRFPDINADALQYYHSSDFLALLVNSLRVLGRQKRREVAMICEYYRHKLIPYFMDALAEEDSQVIRRFLMDQLKRFGDKLIPEAMKRLADERWFVKRNVLYMLAETGAKEVTDQIKTCCRHENPKVSLAAMKYLLNTGDNYAIEMLREFLDSKEKEKIHQGVLLAGSFRIKEVVGELTALLQKQEISGSDIQDKIPVVRALGEIGDPQTVKVLQALLTGKSILYRGITEQLREEIYKTLKNYPYESIRNLIEEGVNSKNEVIRTESDSLKRKYS
ncbi:MAG: HEAT repeat domain-containing protein [Thermodesulfovibrionales bacterium]|nr:HEAT repeat domain-containing protein [Thermodesulfovibrionales bacterium]